MEQVDFYQNSMNLRCFLADNPSVLSSFRKNPVATIRENSLDFSISQDSDAILLSNYLEGVSPTARRVIVSSIIGVTNMDRRAASGDGGDDWIDDVHGGIVATAVAVVNAITVANAVVVVNAIATANANANSNANAISNTNTLGFGSARVDDETANDAQIHLDEDVFTSELTNTLQARGLNVYRRSALLKHLAWKYRPLDSDVGERSTVLAQYKNLEIQLTVDRTRSKWHLVKADLLH